MSQQHFLTHDSYYFPESVCVLNSKINNIKSSKTNKAKGWIFDIDRGPCPWNCFYSTNIGTCDNASWFGWKDGSPVGSISTILYGNGTALITFGNCWKKGLVRLYINGNEVYTVHSNILVTIEFDFNDGDKLELKEHYIGIIRLDDIQIKGCRGMGF